MIRYCRNCNIQFENNENICPFCGKLTEEDNIPSEIYWCDNCNIPLIKKVNRSDRYICPCCFGKLKYLSKDLRPVFPEERLLMEILWDKPLAYLNSSVWASDNRYYIDGKTVTVNKSLYEKYTPAYIEGNLKKYGKENSYSKFDEYISEFCTANQNRLTEIENEAMEFVRFEVRRHEKKYGNDGLKTIVSFSGGKDSTATSDIVMRALSDPSVVHVYCNTTLEFPMSVEYANRYKESHKDMIFRTAMNREQNFYDVCEDIGPPARMMRWCCYMFKTGPISRTLNKMFKDEKILTFYGIRKVESVSRSKYSRSGANDTVSLDNGFGNVKISKQITASPIFFWLDLDVWLYLLGRKVDFNDAYRLGYDRVGCWCCPNNNARAMFLSSIYMPREYTKWRNFLINFAKRIGKPDPEVYVDTGKWKARQGGEGVSSSKDIKINSTVCTTEESARVFSINKPITDEFYTMFVPFGEIDKNAGRKILNEVMIVSLSSHRPILSIQSFDQDGYEYAVKIKVIDAKHPDVLWRQVSYQIRKYNACRKCLKCESLCENGAITINADEYFIDSSKCIRCKKCVTDKYLDGGCLMNRYLKTRD